MSFAWFTPSAPDRPRPPRGAAAVGMISELPPVEMGAILLLRQWCSSEAGRGAIAEDFTAVFGSARAAEAVNQLGHLIRLMVGHGRRPLMRHAETCPCFGGDEAAFAQLMAAAASGDRDDAMAMALTLMPPAIAYEAVQTAEVLGLTIHRFASSLAAGRNRPPRGFLPS